MAAIFISFNSSALVLAGFAFWAGYGCGRSEENRNGSPIACQGPPTVTSHTRKQIPEPSSTIGSVKRRDTEKGTSQSSTHDGNGKEVEPSGQASSTTKEAKHTSMDGTLAGVLHGLHPNLFPSFAPPRPTRPPQGPLPEDSQDGPSSKAQIREPISDTPSSSKTSSSADKNAKRKLEESKRQEQGSAKTTK